MDWEIRDLCHAMIQEINKEHRPLLSRHSRSSWFARPGDVQSRFYRPINNLAGQHDVRPALLRTKITELAVCSRVTRFFVMKIGIDTRVKAEFTLSDAVNPRSPRKSSELRNQSRHYAPASRTRFTTSFYFSLRYKNSHMSDVFSFYCKICAALTKRGTISKIRADIYSRCDSIR